MEIDLPIQTNFSQFLSKTSERLTYPMHQEWNFHDPYSKASGLWKSNTVLHMTLCRMSNNLLCFVDLKLHLDFCCMNYTFLVALKKKSNEKVKVQHGKVACQIKNCASLQMMTKFEWPLKPNQGPIEHLLYPVLHWTGFITC